jgi:bifunctional DNA-binding transcriptional regulator/antitoxin component of YhaV-PrlF toxin-antitoxin module
VASSISFEINAQKHRDGQFSVPSKGCQTLGLENGDNIKLVIQSSDGAVLWSGIKKLSSGKEIYGPEIKDVVKAGQHLKITASR